jgi:murein DD-endopeptidase MepM/ murein hydrolase activator NlpD
MIHRSRRFVPLFVAALIAAFPAAFGAEPARVPPGGLWVLAVPRTTGGSATVTAFGETHPMFLHNGKWEVPLAVYARTKPGRYTAVVREEGRPAIRIALQVVPKAFPTQHIKMQKSKTGLMSPAILARERKILNATYEKTSPEPMWRGAFILPLSGTRVTSDFGRTRYVNGRFWSQHGGLDLASPAGKVTVAGNDGRVVLARKLWMRGNTLALDHGMGLMTVYNHLSAFLVREGDTVKKGQPVGKVGATGFVTGPHLHWEIRAAGSPTNPWPILKNGISLP